MDVSGHQVLASRLAGQGLAEQPADAASVLRGWAVQDSPPGAAVGAMVARMESVAAGWLDDVLFEERSVVALYNARTATAVVAANEVAAYGTSLLPDDDAGLKAIVGPALPDRKEGFAEPVAAAVEAIGETLDGVVLSRDDLHEELRQRLSEELLPWCPGCKSHHARRGLLVMASLHGRLCLAGRVGRQPAFARTDQWATWDAPPRTEAGAELVRRYLTGYGPSTAAHFAQWAGLGKAHARELWALVEDELTEVQLDRGTHASLLARDLPLLEQPPAAPGVRLLAPGDPLLLGRDREQLIPDEQMRKRLWSAIGGPGLVLADGDPVALWRARKQGRRLDVSIEAFGSVPQGPVEAAAERLAPHRSCDTVAIEFATA